MMQVVAFVLFLAAVAVQHSIAGNPKALRASTPLSTPEVSLEVSLRPQGASAARDEHHFGSHHHRVPAKISLMTIASERRPTIARDGVPKHGAADHKERSHLEDAHLSKVGQQESHELDSKHRRGSHTDDEASNAKTSADVVIHVDSDASAAGAVAYDNDATAGEFRDNHVAEGGEDRETASVYHTIAKTHAVDDIESAHVVNVVASAESEDKAASDSKNADVSDVATTSEGKAKSKDVVDSAGGADSEDDASENTVVSVDVADSEGTDSSDIEEAGDSEIASVDSDIISISKGADVEVEAESEIAEKTEGMSKIEGSTGSEISDDTEVASESGDGAADTDASAAMETDVLQNEEVQPEADSAVAEGGLPGQVPGSDGEVMPEPTPSDEGDGARTEPGSDPGSLNIGSSVMQATAVGPADSYHDGSTESADWGKEYGAAAQDFQEKIKFAESRSATSRQGEVVADSSGSGSMALVAGLIIIFGLLVCALGLGTKL